VFETRAEGIAVADAAFASMQGQRGMAEGLDAADDSSLNIITAICQTRTLTYHQSRFWLPLHQNPPDYGTWRSSLVAPSPAVRSDNSVTARFLTLRAASISIKSNRLS
jgi:hypothetical protein